MAAVGQVKVQQSAERTEFTFFFLWTAGWKQQNKLGSDGNMFVRITEINSHIDQPPDFSNLWDEVTLSGGPISQNQ